MSELIHSFPSSLASLSHLYISIAASQELQQHSAHCDLCCEHSLGWTTCTCEPLWAHGAAEIDIDPTAPRPWTPGTAPLCGAAATSHCATQRTQQTAPQKLKQKAKPGVLGSSFGPLPWHVIQLSYFYAQCTNNIWIFSWLAGAEYYGKLHWGEQYASNHKHTKLGSAV